MRLLKKAGGIPPAFDLDELSAQMLLSALICGFKLRVSGARIATLSHLSRHFRATVKPILL
ncbi:hypothetical protein [Enterococcus sp.]|uniref:hypothetical protein n=1 Tax=Enterococcus sp. TaxID=35783 RepID=UPI003C754DDD